MSASQVAFNWLSSFHFIQYQIFNIVFHESKCLTKSRTHTKQWLYFHYSMKVLLIICLTSKCIFTELLMQCESTFLMHQKSFIKSRRWKKYYALRHLCMIVFILIALSHYSNPYIVMPYSTRVPQKLLHVSTKLENTLALLKSTAVYPEA